jgi:hypothetical protein
MTQLREISLCSYKTTKQVTSVFHNMLSLWKFLKVMQVHGISCHDRQQLFIDFDHKIEN